MSGDYLRLESKKVREICPAPGIWQIKFAPRRGNFTKKFARGAGIWPVSKKLLQLNKKKVFEGLLNISKTVQLIITKLMSF